MITDENEHILAVNRAFERLTGYRREEVLGRKPSLLKSGQHGPEFYRAMKEKLRDDGYWEGEVWNRRLDGEVFPEWLAISGFATTAAGCATTSPSSSTSASARRTRAS